MVRLVPAQTVLFVVDVQERLASAMPEATLAELVHNAGILLDAAKILGVEVVVSEQYPKGLGHTLPALSAKIASRCPPFPKTTFDACSDLALARRLDAVAPRAVIVLGMETHVCVFQTARELVHRGYATYVVADAVASRTEENRRLGLALSERAGAIPIPTESVVFDWTERAGTDAFKAISKLVK